MLCGFLKSLPDKGCKSLKRETVKCQKVHFLPTYVRASLKGHDLRVSHNRLSSKHKLESSVEKSGEIEPMQVYRLQLIQGVKGVRLQSHLMTKLEFTLEKPAHPAVLICFLYYIMETQNKTISPQIM